MKLTTEQLIAKTNEAFLERNGFNSVGITWVVVGNTYEVKDELKAAGCKFNHELKWHSPEPVKGFQCVPVNIDEFETFNGFYTMHFKDQDSTMAKINRANDMLYAMDKRASEYVGTVGDKISMNLNVMDCFYSNMYGFHIYKFVDNCGNIFTWKTGTGLDLRKGQKVSLKGTIKAHSEYRMVRETIVTRCKLAF